MKRLLALFVFSLCLAGGASPACAAILLDLGFTNGLGGWKSSDASLVSAVGGVATIAESSFALETDLYQDFKVPAGTSTLSFTLNFVRADRDDPNVPPPDAFGASLISPTTLKPLVPTVAPSTDSFYIRDVVQGVTMGEAAPGVTLSPSPGALPLSITVDASQLLPNQNARILFRLLAGGDLSSSSVGISAVHVNGTPTNPIPEPASLPLISSGLVLLVGSRVLRRGRSPLVAIVRGFLATSGRPRIAA